MVKESRRDDRIIYICEVCNVAYEDKEWAEKCQAWDELHPGSCNLEVVQHSIPLEDN